VCQSAFDCEWRLRGNRTSKDDNVHIMVTVCRSAHTCIAGFERRSVSSPIA